MIERTVTASTRSYYTVESLSWQIGHGWGRLGYWATSGTGGMYKTHEDAEKRIKEDLKRVIENKVDLSEVKFRIKKVVEITSTEEELTGSDFTAFMLKTA